MVAIAAVGDPAEQTLTGFFFPAVGLASILLPVLEILSVTSEFSQRTSLTTFALVPQRERVVAAKLLAGVVLALGAVLDCLVVAAAATALVPAIGDADGSWNLGVSDLAQGALYQTLGALGGAAIALVLMRSAPAIVLAYVLPTAFGIVTGTIPGFGGSPSGSTPRLPRSRWSTAP